MSNTIIDSRGYSFKDSDGDMWWRVDGDRYVSANSQMEADRMYTKSAHHALSEDEINAWFGPLDWNE